jgi:hypothetical protein
LHLGKLILMTNKKKQFVTLKFLVDYTQKNLRPKISLEMNFLGIKLNIRNKFGTKYAKNSYKLFISTNKNCLDFNLIKHCS